MQANAQTIEEPQRDVSPVERALILKTFPGFAALPASHLALLAAVARVRTFPEGAALLEPGLPVHAFYLVVDGEVEMLMDGTPAKTFGPRSSVGGLAALTQDPNGAHAVALRDTLALEVDREDMQDVFEDSFPTLLGVLGALATTLREAQQKIGGAAISGKKEVDGIDGDRKLDLVERMFLLRKTVNFANTRIEALADLAQDTTEVRFAAGETLWRVGDPGDHSVMTLSGEIECTPEAGAPFTFVPGYVVGGLDSLAQQPRWYLAIATTELRGLRFERGALLDVLEDNVDMAMELLRALAMGVMAIYARSAEASGPPAP